MTSLLRKSTARAILIVFAIAGVAWLGYVALHHREKLSLEVLDLIPAGERAPELALVRDLANEKQARVALFALHVPAAADDETRDRAARAFIDALLASNAFVEAEISGDTASRNALGKAIFDHRLDLLAPGWLAKSAGPGSAEFPLGRRREAPPKPPSGSERQRHSANLALPDLPPPDFSAHLADRTASALEQFMSKPEALAFGEIIGHDPLLLLPSLVEKVQGLDATTGTDSSTTTDSDSDNPQSEIRNPQSTPILIWSLTRDKPLDPAGQRPVFDAVDTALAAARAVAPETAETTLRWTAVSRFAAENERHIIRETIAGTLLSLLVVLAIAAICLPSLPKALMLMPVVLGALIGACAAVTICFDRVHFLVFVLGLMLVGVSIDYGFYLYLQPRARPGDTYEGKVRRLMKPLLGSALTTVLGFTLLLFSDLPLIRQLGVFVSAGLLCAIAVAVLWFAQIKNPWLQARPFAAAQLRATPRARRAALVILALGALVALAGPWRLHWRDDVQTLQISMPQLAREAAEVRALFGDTKNRAVYITRGENIASARDNLEKFLAWHAAHFPDAPTATLGEAIPLRADYDALPARLAELGDFAPQLRAALERHGFEPDEFAPFFAAWNEFAARHVAQNVAQASEPAPTTFAHQQSLANQQLADSPLVAQTAKSAKVEAGVPTAFEDSPKAVGTPASTLYDTAVARLAASLRGQTALLMSATPGASWLVTVAAHPAGGAEPPAALATVSLNQVETLNGIFTRYRLSALRLSIIGLTLVGLSMWLIYGVRRGSYIFATPVGSCLFAFGVLGLLGVTLNLFHLLGAFLGVCLSHNFAIFNAENEARRELPPPSIRLSALCTAASFGILACSGIPVVSALGVTVMLIVLTALAVVELRRVAKTSNPEPPAPAAPASTRRNPGPSWGYRFLRATDMLLPEFVNKPLRAAGTFIAMLFMPAQRRHSRDYLSLVLPRPPAWRDIFRHFFAFEETLMAKLRLLNGKPHRTTCAPDCPGDLKHWLDNGGSVLIGSFHIGVSDMQSFQLGAYDKHRVYVLRERVGNAHDTEKLAEKFGANLRFIWINDPGEMVFALKEALADPAASIALKCDRIEERARTAAFDFLGARRLFPVTIYLLAAIFKRPVILCFGIPTGPQAATLYSSPRLDVLPGETRESFLARGHGHFQNFLRVVETQLRAHPYLWFNFLPMNPPAPTEQGRNN